MPASEHYSVKKQLPMRSETKRCLSLKFDIHEIRNEGDFIRKKLIEKVGSLVFCVATLIKMFEKLIPLGLAHVRVRVNVIKSAFFRWIARLYQVFISTLRPRSLL